MFWQPSYWAKNYWPNYYWPRSIPVALELVTIELNPLTMGVVIDGLAPATGTGEDMIPSFMLEMMNRMRRIRW